MELDEHDRRLLAAVEDGLPFVAEPYRAVGEAVGLSEAEVLTRLGRLVESGVIKRFGVVVRHHELGYRHNAMVVWDVPDAEVAAIAERFCAYDFVTLCYRRARRPPEWPYNLFCMIHGRDRAVVLDQVRRIEADCGLAAVPHEVLFSGQRFKQRGARYASLAEAAS